MRPKVSRKRLDEALQVVYQRTWEDRARVESWVVGEGPREGKYPMAIVCVAILPITWETLLSSFGDLMANAVEAGVIPPPRATDSEDLGEEGPT